MRAETPGPVGPLPLHYPALPGHPPLFAARRKREPRSLRDNVVGFIFMFGLIVPVFGSVIIGSLRHFLASPDLISSIFLVLFVVAPVGLILKMAWGSFRAGIVVDARGVHRAHGMSSGAVSLFADEIVDIEPIRILTRAHHKGVQSPRYFLGNEATDNVYLTLETPMGDARAIVGVHDMAGFLAALETARAMPPVAWQPVGTVAPPLDDPSRLDVAIRTDGGDLSLRHRGFSFSRRRQAPLDGIAEIRVSRDPLLRRELRARRGYNIGIWFATASLRAFSHPGVGWDMRWVGKNRAAGAVILVLEAGGVIVVSTDHPEHVALRIQELLPQGLARHSSRATAGTRD